ncbi:MAG TPA: STAS domain-containing protein [Rhodocyclaceae bacterium]|nr:STAS domain-containing protein [Rhodocyclaceae bacterium]
MEQTLPKQARLKLEGELTIFNARQVADTLLGALAQGIGMEVDLGDVAEIDSAGLQVMIAAKRLATGQGKTLSFTGHSPAVLEILDLTDLVGFFGDPVVIERASA